MTYKYEVSFSFLAKDELIAYKLNDRLQDRVSTFIYSKKQEELGGQDGERKFSKVFYEESRIVVVLFRDGWGKTPWTRIEETSIKNRAFDKGWDFLVFINLDDNSCLPHWIPRTYIWIDYKRFKVDGAVAIIEQRIKEQGGTTTPETIENRADRLKRLRNAEKGRNEFLRSPEAIQEAQTEIKKMISRLKEIKPTLEDPSTYLHLGESERPQPPMYEFGYDGFYLCFNNSTPFQYDVQDGILKITLYEKSGHHGFDYKENVLKQKVFRFDRDLVENNGWSDHKTSKIFKTTDELIDQWVKEFLEEVEKRK